MRKFYSLCFVLSLWINLTASAQYYFYETTISCTGDDKEQIMAGHRAIKEALDGLVKEDKLITYDSEEGTEGEHTTLSYFFLAEGDASFTALSKEWQLRVNTKYPKQFKEFWTLCPTRLDTLANTSKIFLPAIKHVNSPVAEVPHIDERPDPKLQYNIVIDLVSFSKVRGRNKLDSSAINWGLSDIGRFYNLHVAAGIPREKINIVVAVHGGATHSFLNHHAYAEKYKTDNPNVDIINKLHAAGIRFLVCGQSITWMGYSKEKLLPEARITLTAQTTLTSYQLKGYALKELSND